MKRRCKKLRDRAVRDGLDSRAGAAWRIHGKSCRDCRTEMFVLETLQQQAEQQRRHLPRRDVALLIEAARRAHSPSAPWQSLWSWSWRVAAFSVLVVFLIAVSHDSGVEQTSSEVTADALMLAQVADEASGNYAVPLVPLSALHDRSVDLIVRPGNAVAMPAVMTGRLVNRRVQQLRLRIDQRRHTLLEMIERDLGEGLREGAWRMQPLLPSLAV